MKYLNERNEEEKEFIEDLNEEAIEHKREANEAQRLEDKNFIDHHIEESVRN